MNSTGGLIMREKQRNYFEELMKRNET